MSAEGKHIDIILPDGSKRSFESQPTILDVANNIGSRLGQDTLGGFVNGQSEIKDLRFLLNHGDKLEIVTTKSGDSALEVIRHSAAHVMAEAVQKMWPEAKVTIGPVIDGGFYYDFDIPVNFQPDDLVKIEKKMYELIHKKTPVTREVFTKSEAEKKFSEQGEAYKLELIQDIADTEEISIYHQDSWYDLCRGPHVQHLGQIKAIKLTTIAGAYWRGDEKNQQLQRIYGTAFFSQKELEEHLALIEEAKKRDHRKVGKDLGLFHFHPYAPGSPFFTPKGTFIYRALQEYMQSQYVKRGYQEVMTPQIFDVELYKKSGHYDNYAENMFFSNIDDRSFSVKPMNCPGHCVLYKAEKKSYRDLPWRIADFGRLHRYERSGTMHGLTRVRTFCQDDAHIFCTIEQLQSEITGFIGFLDEVYKALGMPHYKISLSTRPEKRMGSDEVWDQSEAILKSALDELGLDYKINAGDGAFYGPKLDIEFVDALKRPWQLGTLQCDFLMPEGFELDYVGSDNTAHRPVMLHRAILGSFERFIGVYLEHVGGKLPTWLNPNQVRILTLTDQQLDYANELKQMLMSKNIRVHIDSRSEKLGLKIRESQLERVSYMLILGEKEQTQSKVSLRLLDGSNHNFMEVEEFLGVIQQDISEKHFQSPLICAS